MQRRQAGGARGSIAIEKGFSDRVLARQAIPPFAGIARQQQQPHLLRARQRRLKHRLDQGEQDGLSGFRVVDGDQNRLRQTAQVPPGRWNVPGFQAMFEKARSPAAVPPLPAQLECQPCLAETTGAGNEANGLPPLRVIKPFMQRIEIGLARGIERNQGFFSAQQLTVSHAATALPDWLGNAQWPIVADWGHGRGEALRRDLPGSGRRLLSRRHGRWLGNDATFLQGPAKGLGRSFDAGRPGVSGHFFSQLRRFAPSQVGVFGNGLE